jgi:hypothetical protein
LHHLPPVFLLPLEPSLQPSFPTRNCDGEIAIAVRLFHQAAHRGSRNVVALGDLCRVSLISALTAFPGGIYL